MENKRIIEINNDIKEKYFKYRELFSNISILTDDIRKLEEEKSSIIEKDGRRLIFKRPVIDLRSFNEWAKETKWCEILYENFEENKNILIVDEAMIISVYSYQTNYMSPVNIIVSLDGYLNQEEYEKIKLINPKLPNYYKENKEGKNGRTKI
jgi:hypothetical protein